MADSPDKSTESASGGLIGKIPSPRAVVTAVRSQPLVSLMIGGGTVLALIIVGGLLQPLMVGPPTASDREKALAAIDAGDFEAARFAAVGMYGEDLSFEESGMPFYILGAAAGLEAEATLDARRRSELLVLATKYLEASRDRGFPPEREVDGSLRLARYLFESGQYARSLPIVTHAIETSSTLLPEAERLLAGAYSRDSNPDYDKALVHIDNYLSAPGLSDSAFRNGQIEKARILIGLEQFSNAHALLAQVAPSATNSDLLLIQGELALAESQQTIPPDPAVIARAITLLESAVDRDPSNPKTTSRADYFLGLAKRSQGDLDGAIKHLLRVSKIHEETPEGWSASLVQGEILLEREENEAALEALNQAARNAGAAPSYSNPLIPLIEFRSRLREAFALWNVRGEFAIANEFAKELPPLVTEAESVQMRGDVYRRWGESLSEEAAQAPLSIRRQISADARKRHRMAAKFYAWLAELRFATAHHPDDLWESSQQFLAGNDFEQASRMLRKYLEVELRLRRPEALTSLAKAQLALGNVEQAAKSIDDVLENYPNHPEIYRARLIGSDIELERRMVGADDELAYLATARELLDANLNEEALTPRSLEWRDSLFALGRVLSLEATALETNSRTLGVDFRGDEEITKIGLRELEKAVDAYEVAIRRLSEATRRYPNAPQATLSSYLLAEAYRNAAKLPRKKLPLVLIQTTRVQLERDMYEHLSKAYDIYKSLQSKLNQKQETEELSETELSILRNCYFARADCLFEKGLYEEAIREYSTATNRYQHEPSALEAFVQIASCYRLLGRPYEARGTLEQAKVVLERIRDDADFAAVTRYDRQEWGKLLDLLSTL